MKKFIESIPLDKLRHLALGVLYSVLIPFLGLLFGDIGAFIGLFIGTFLNLYKELYHDMYQGKGNAELEDFFYNQIPILLVFMAYLL